MTNSQNSSSLNQIKALNAASELIQNARREASSGSTVIWRKISRIEQYIDRQISEALTALESA